MQLTPSYSRVLLFISIAALLTLFTHQMSNHIIQATLPLYEWMLNLLEYRFDQATIQLANQHGESILQVNTILSQPFWVIDSNGASQRIAPTEVMGNTASLAVGNILQPLVIIGTIALAWPVSLKKEVAILQTSPALTTEAQLHSSHVNIKTVLVYIYRLLLAFPFTILIMLVDTPVQLLHGSWGGMAAGLQLGENFQITNIAWFGYWSDFINGGGLIALSIAVGLLVVGVVEYWQASAINKQQSSRIMQRP